MTTINAEPQRSQNLLIRILCVLCGFALIVVTTVAQAPELQTESVWSCPVHAVVNEENPGKCPICRRELVIVTATITWTCPGHPEIDRPARGRCADGSQMEKRYTQSTHANHNPRHGGLFFMAPDLWHHLEGAYIDDAFRVYLYDDYTKPLAPDLRRAVTGRVVTKETFDPKTRTTTEITVFPLRLSADAEYLEARVGKIKFPSEMTAKVRFTRGGEEYRFDFTFAEPSIDKTVVSDGPVSLFEVPDDVKEVRKLLVDRVATITELVKKGAFSEVWVPAFQAKDLAIALDLRTAELAVADRPVAHVAVERVVRAAWALDAAGDIGNRADVEDASTALSAAAGDLEKTFSK
jgi:hypothetical protein